MKYHVAILAALSFLLGISCQSMMNAGIPGSERGLLHPYKNTDEKIIDLSFSGQVGATAAPATLEENTYFKQTKFVKSDLSLQWQNMLSTNRLFGSASVSAWAGKLSDSTDTGYDTYVTSKDNDTFFGGAIALRIGEKKVTNINFYSVPSFELLYAFEGGPYYELRKNFVNDNAINIDAPNNLKPNRSSMRFSVIPLDRTIFLKRSSWRISFLQGWSDQWLHYLIDTVNETIPADWNTLLLIFPSYYCFDFSFQPYMSKLFFSFNWNITNYYHESDMSSVLGIALGIGYLIN